MMNKKNFNKAVREVNELIKERPGFKNIIFDDWRGWRFVFDTPEVRNCKNDCQNCGLYQLLNQRKYQTDYARLIKAGQTDRKMFGRENFLNCKSLEEYKKCYVYFILNKTETKQEIWNELDLLMGMKVIYSYSETSELSEYRFKKEVISSVLAGCSETKKKIIKDYLNPINKHRTLKKSTRLSK